MPVAHKRKDLFTSIKEKTSTHHGHEKGDHINGGPEVDLRGSSSAVQNGGDGKEHDSFGASLQILNVVIGLIVMVAIGTTHALYMYQIHENHMWFSNIKEVEREISFRTESGLYYSYYKQMVKAATLKQGLEELTQDKTMEHPDTINVLQRMNIYQDVILACIYKTFGIKMEPILFYTYSIFALHGCLVAALYTVSWLLTGSWMAGLLTAAFYIFNRIDTTRVAYTVPLRESFSLPFIWMQAASITSFFQSRKTNCWQHIKLLSVFLTTFFFCLFWQFNQFIMMLQGFALFAVWVLGLVPAHKVLKVVICQQLSFYHVCLLQFGNTMLLGSLAVSFNFGFIALLLLIGNMRKTTSVFRHLLKIGSLSLFSLLTMVVLSKGMKMLLNVDSDEHIFKFLQNKFGVGDERDFDSRLYLCLGIFGFIGTDVVHRMTQGFVFPPYALTHVALLGYLLWSIVAGWRSEIVKSELKSKQRDKETHRSALFFHIIQSVFFCALAIMTERMKYLWTPYICILAAVGIANSGMWTYLLSWGNIRGKWKVSVVQNSVVVLILAVMTKLLLPPVLNELEVLSEFWDPDTVDLMEWIIEKTPQAAAFTGSMQLLAGVKLCTGHPITNHPHYEDKYLRYKTKQLYQIYGRREPQDVHKIVTQYQSSYIILEDSICRAPSDGCRTPDIVDIDNGVKTDADVGILGLVTSPIPRFCEELRHQKSKYLKYFKSVFVNKTFRVYKVMHG